MDPSFVAQAHDLFTVDDRPAADQARVPAPACPQYFDDVRHEWSHALIFGSAGGRPVTSL